MKQIMGIYRYFYNRCVDYFNNYDKKIKQSWFYIDPKNEKTKTTVNITNNPYNLINMRSKLKKNVPKWILNNFPSHLIDQALIEAFDKFKICLDQYKKTRKKFNFKYKSKKDIRQTINLEKSMINSKYNGLFV